MLLMLFSIRIHAPMFTMTAAHSSRILTVFLLATLFLTSACTPKPKTLDVRASVVDSADLVIFADSAAISKAPIVGILKKHEDSLSKQNPSANMELGLELLEALGLSSDDLSTFIASVSNITEASKENYDAVSLSVAATFHKEIDVDLLYAYLSEKAKADGNEITRDEFEGVPLFAGTFNAEPSKVKKPRPIKLVMAPINSGDKSLLILGDDSTVKAAVSRVNLGWLKNAGTCLLASACCNTAQPASTHRFQSRRHLETNR